MKKIASIARFVASEVGMREIFLVVGLGLSSYGISLVHLPASFIAPGAVLVLIAVFGVRGQGQEKIRVPKSEEEQRKIRVVK